MTQRTIAVFLACFACSAASGQGSGQLPSFAVASVKPGVKLQMKREALAEIA